MKSECHGGGALFFSFPLSYQRGKHFHEPGGIHLILPSLFTYNYTEVTVACQDKNAITFIYFCSHYHHDIKSQDKNARLRNVLCCTQNCTRGVVLEGEWLHYLGEISSPSLFWGKKLQVY